MIKFLTSITTILALLTLSEVSNATVPILKEGRKWLTRVEYARDNDNETSKYWFYVDKDTVINGTDAKKILCEPAEDYDVVNVEKRFYAS